MESKAISAAIDALEIIPTHIDLIIKDGHFSDKWHITLNYRERSMYFDYYMGIGHRNEPVLCGSRRDMYKNILTRNLVVNDNNRKLIKQYSEPARPMEGNIQPATKNKMAQKDMDKRKYLKADDIIYCLTSDIRCLECSGDKYEFMEEFGYEDFRKGEEVYNAIVEQKRNLKELLGSYYHEWLEKEIKRLEDY